MSSLFCNPFAIRAWGMSLIVSLLAGALAEETGSLSETLRKERLRKIRGIVEPFNVTAVNGQDAQPARLLDVPSLLYADNAREVSDSSLWIWELSGRPVSATTVEANRPPTEAEYWTFEFAGLSAQKLQLSLTQDQQWMTDPSAVTLRSIANAPAVAETRAVRAQQMKRLSERFAAAELHRAQGRIELRRLSTPVYRQAEAASGDGAIFVFAHGTNPEVVLSIGTSTTRPAVWNYSLGALSAEELFVTLDGQEVWRETRFTMPGSRLNYLNGRLPSIAE